MSDGAGTLMGGGVEGREEKAVVGRLRGRLVGSLRWRLWAVWTLDGFGSKTHANTLVTRVCNSPRRLSHD